MLRILLQKQPALSKSYIFADKNAKTIDIPLPA